MLYLIYLSFLTAIFFILFSIFGMSSRSASVRLRLPQEASYQIKRAKLDAYTAPLIRVSNFILEKGNLKQRLSRSLSASHLRLKPTEFFSLQLILMFVLAVVGFFIFSKLHTPALVAALILGYLLPEFWLMRRIRLRKQAIVRFFPETVDLLVLCVEAGLDFISAADWIIRKTRHTPLVEELAVVLEEIKLGKPHHTALKDMSKRLNIQEVTSFVQSMVQSERMGTPAVETFSNISEDSRLQRFRRGERFALKAPLKILIPLVFCILPVIVIIIGGPIIIQFMQGSVMLKGF